MLKLRALAVTCALCLATSSAAYSPAREWKVVRRGIEVHEVEAEQGDHFRLVLVRIDPRQFRFELTPLATQPRGGAWTIARAPDSAAIAFNVGQFTGQLPWGWIVRNGRELLRPGYGPLSTAIVIDSTGAFHFVDAPAIAGMRASRIARLAFQSYPSLLIGDGRIPEQLLKEGRGVDLEHRDSRLAIGLLRDGRILIVLSRFSEFDGALGAVPVGPNVREMAELMKSHGCVKAVMLDGGISGQLLLRTANGKTLSWRGWRKVPVGMIAFPN